MVGGRVSRQAAEDRRAIETTVASLQALAGAGLEHVEIAKVLGWLGVKTADRPSGFSVLGLEPDVDPMTGCKPVTAQPVRLEPGTAGGVAPGSHQIPRLGS